MSEFNVELQPDVNKILVAGGSKLRKSDHSVTSKRKKKLENHALTILKRWKTEGIPDTASHTVYDHKCRVVLRSFGIRHSAGQALPNNTAVQRNVHSGPTTIINESVHLVSNSSPSNEKFNSNLQEQQVVRENDELFVVTKDSCKSSDTLYFMNVANDQNTSSVGECTLEEENVRDMSIDEYANTEATFHSIAHVTLLLKLLKHFSPEANYSSFPATCATLL
ncbi:uncharacterized protein LOC130704367 isoform X2 [Daphnia carinata]|nr:uncharacterized protein LOC130704367 isoform X2 [Daphnia carinata]